jgi:hypothetical protein
MTQATLINQIRQAFGSVENMDPSGSVYPRLCALLDRCDNDALKAVYAARIRFVSGLALNRMIRRGIADSI